MLSLSLSLFGGGVSPEVSNVIVLPEGMIGVDEVDGVVLHSMCE